MLFKERGRPVVGAVEGIPEVTACGVRPFLFLSNFKGFISKRQFVQQRLHCRSYVGTAMNIPPLYNINWRGSLNIEMNYPGYRPTKGGGSVVESITKLVEALAALLRALAKLLRVILKRD